MKFLQQIIKHYIHIHLLPEGPRLLWNTPSSSGHSSFIRSSLSLNIMLRSSRSQEQTAKPRCCRTPDRLESFYTVFMQSSADVLLLETPQHSLILLSGQGHLMNADLRVIPHCSDQRTERLERATLYRSRWTKITFFPEWLTEGFLSVQTISTSVSCRRNELLHDLTDWSQILPVSNSIISRLRCADITQTLTDNNTINNRTALVSHKNAD